VVAKPDIIIGNNEYHKERIDGYTGCLIFIKPYPLWNIVLEQNVVLVV
jgi:hypothetical protein